MTRRRLVLALGLALAVLVVVVWRLMPRPPYIDQAHCALIKPGMRLEEVEAILGAPPGAYEGGQFSHRIPRAPDGTTYWGTRDGDDGWTIIVQFHEDGTVKHAEILGFTHVYTNGPGLWKWLRALLP